MVDIFSKFNLSNDNIVSTVRDNGSNFVKAFKEFGCKMKTSNNDSDTDSDGGILYIIYFVIIDFITANGSIYLNMDKDLNKDDELSFLVVDENNDGDILLPQNLRCASHTLSLLATTYF